MASLVIETQPTNEPVDLSTMKNHLRVVNTDDDGYISGLIVAAREAVEAFTGRSLCIKGYRQSLDSFPYFVDTTMSQMAYPPSYYALPRYSTTLWNYSQMIKLFAPPLVNVSSINYLSGTDNQWHALTPIPQLWYPLTSVVLNQEVMDKNGNVQMCVTPGKTNADPPTWSKVLNADTAEVGGGAPVWQNMGPAILTGNTGLSSTGPNAQFGSFIFDQDSEPARIFPGPPGATWPPVVYVPNAVQIHFTAGYSADGSAVPSTCKAAMMQLCGGWYENREPYAPGTYGKIPDHIERLLWTKRVFDFQPTRG
jgi:Phage gp6-like head-tail connector protein